MSERSIRLDGLLLVKGPSARGQVASFYTNNSAGTPMRVHIKMDHHTAAAMLQAVRWWEYCRHQELARVSEKRTQRLDLDTGETNMWQV